MLLASTENSTGAAAIQVSGMVPPDAGFELRHLRYFIAVAEHLHFGRAARALHISQPPLSRQIQDLEYQVGVQLLCRSSRSVKLTAAGEVFFAESKRILSLVCRSLDTVRLAAGGEAGRCDIGVSAFLESGCLSPLRAALTSKLREAEFNFHRLDTEEQIRLIRNRTLVAGLVLLPVENADQIRIEPLFRLPAVALVAISHPFAGHSEISLRDVASSAVIGVRDDFVPRSYDHVEHIARMCGVPIHVKKYVPDLGRLFQDVRQTGSVAILPCSAQQLAGAEMRSVPISEPDADFTFGVAHQRGCDYPLLKGFLETLHEVTLSRTPKCTYGPY
jgi:DNA-binding transcriptional LysR family regulator